MKILLKMILMAGLLGFGTSANSKVQIDRLLTKDLDEMRSLVNEYIQKSEKLAIQYQDEGSLRDEIENVAFELKKASLVVLARPNRDFINADLLPSIRSRLLRYNYFFKTMKSLTRDSIVVVEDKEQDVRLQSAHLYVIQNVMSELLPEIKEQKEVQEIFKMIADEKIKIPKKLKKFRRMERMEDGKFNPSKLARKKLNKALGKKRPWWKFW